MEVAFKEGTPPLHLMNNHGSTVHCAAAQGGINCGSCGHNESTEQPSKNP